jgi:hypothetical protein
MSGYLTLQSRSRHLPGEPVAELVDVFLLLDWQRFGADGGLVIGYDALGESFDRFLLHVA